VNSKAVVALDVKKPAECGQTIPTAPRSTRPSDYSMSGRYAARDAEYVERAIRGIVELSPGNQVCADCSTPNPEYLNLTIGTFVCEQCADVHRTSSNRRIKDMFGRELTSDDVHRMREVGNDVANRKFLARWNPREFPEPNPADKEMLREFIWLKYEGSWKRNSAPPASLQPSSHAHAGYGTRAPASRPYGEQDCGRESRLFREAPRPAEAPPRQSYWAERYGHPTSEPLVDRTAPRRVMRDPEYGSSNSYQQQRRSSVPQAVASYRRRAPPPRSTRYDGPSVDEVYASLDSGSGSQSGVARRGDVSRSREAASAKASSRQKKKKSGRKNRVEAESETDDFSEASVSESEEEDGKKNRSSARDKGKKKSSENGRSSKHRSKRSEKRAASESEDESDDAKRRSPRRGKKASPSSKVESKKKPSKHRAKQESSDTGSDSSDSHDSEDRRGKKLQRAASRSSGKKHSGGANPFASDDEVKSGWLPETKTESVPRGSAGCADFDLMSEWMGNETDAATTASSASNPSAVLPVAGPHNVTGMYPSQHPGQANAQVLPPMSVYPGMMPMPMGMPMPIGMQGAMMYPPPMQFHQPTQFSGPMPPMPPMMSGLNGLMHNMSMYAPVNNPGEQPPLRSQQAPAPPPPPPPATTGELPASSPYLPPRPAFPPPPE
jgi:ribosomal protein L37AE/L43A